VPYTPSATAQAIALQAATNLAALGVPLPAALASIVGGNLGPAAFWDALSNFTGYNSLSFLNGWSNFGGALNPCGYMKDALGFVHLQGCAMGGTIALALATLPAGYRPANTCLFAVVAGGTTTISRLDVTAAGQIICQGGNNAFVSLEGITFLAVN
jgi:hypothetical protein